MLFMLGGSISSSHSKQIDWGSSILDCSKHSTLAVIDYSGANIELDWIELYWIELNLIELNWIEMN